ncbi:alcohol dehydrogenase catalytic domain-containing protein [Streptomyces litchfieldiae]|uniref:Alcohol dehydrogenase catalytic domain-containing protein n=1 Tax=Streptomyces litchfieldiae TaxID=3075543 RepID=A0ABU2MK17_9ACTN|nr:alcohol dehydrogenase catalytic domain-containing protein [Streptomyces sp. DSM 44938]MDT0341942.1 alcohol dehydrogenase catalytic domain-containing protein [Streptomyces sp. DSM 44938]
MKTQAAVLHDTGLPRPYSTSRPLRLADVELADPGPGELRVAVDAVGVCHSDLSVVDGTRPRPTPIALGHEATGIVDAVGEAVPGLTPGDRVVLVFVPGCGRCERCAIGRPAHCVNGARANTEGTLLSGARRLSRAGTAVNHHLGVSGFARHTVVDHRSTVVVPRDVPAPIAALFGCAVLTGVGAVLNTARLRPGESAVVVGLGGVGLAALLGAVLAGAHPIVAIDPVPGKRDLARDLGATLALAPGEAPELRRLLPDGADAVIETAGSTAALATAWTLTRPGGRTVSAGLPDPGERFSLPVTELVGQGRQLLGSYLGDSVPQRDIARYLTLWREGRLPVDRLLGGTAPLSAVNDTLETMAAGQALRQVLLPAATP